MALIYKNVYSCENGKLVRNTENKVEYTDKNGIKRIKTNPTYKDFALVNKYPKKIVGEVPKHDREKEAIKEIITFNGNEYEVSYLISEKEVKQ